jgi:hypothetical protein
VPGPASQQKELAGTSTSSVDAPSSDEGALGVDEVVVSDVVGAVVNETAELLLGTVDAVVSCALLTVVDTDWSDDPHPLAVMPKRNTADDVATRRQRTL